MIDLLLKSICCRCGSWKALPRCSAPAARSPARLPLRASPLRCNTWQMTAQRPLRPRHACRRQCSRSILAGLASRFSFLFALQLLRLVKLWLVELAMEAQTAQLEQRASSWAQTLPRSDSSSAPFQQDSCFYAAPCCSLCFWLESCSTSGEKAASQPSMRRPSAAGLLLSKVQPLSSQF